MIIVRGTPPATVEAEGDGAAAGLGDREFALFQRLVLEASGIALGDTKRQLVVARLGRRVRVLGLRSFGEYYRYVMSDRTGGELVMLVDLISTNETHFFREPQHFEFIERQLVPTWRADAAAGERPRRLRVWSAACSTGQEVYSLGMVLLEHLPAAEGWQLEIVGSDISTRALRAAAAATWPVALAAEIPPHLLAKYMLRGARAQTGRMRAGRELRSVVSFARVNLQEPSYPVPGSFDLILCRNVLIYFTAEARRRVVEGLAARLAPGGHLLVGHAESVHGATGRLRAVAPTIYTTA